MDTVLLLAVSRDPSLGTALRFISESNQWHVEIAGGPWEAMERVQLGLVPQVLLLDLPGEEDDSLYVLRWLRRLRPELPIILLSCCEDFSRKTDLVRLGAKDFLVRPFTEEQLDRTIRRHLASAHASAQATCTSEDIENLGDDIFFVGTSTVMHTLRAQVELLSQADVPILIVGEFGSGRETVARLIHKLSVRSEFRFKKVNCGALPGDLLEKEIFGNHQKVFEDDRSNDSKLELCDKGTIFLEEIASLPIKLQANLLHVMQTKEYMNSDGHTRSDFDVRVLATTSENVDRALWKSALREDLYCLLSAFTIHVPPLRQRSDEIPFLLKHFMHKLAKHYSLSPRDLSPAVLEASQRYSWPGNLRELENFIKKYLLIGDAELPLGRSDAVLTHNLQSSGATSEVAGENSENESYLSGSAPKSLKSLIENVKSEAEKNAIAAALERTGWNRKAAARLLRVSYRTMLYKIVQYKMEFPDTYSFFHDR